MPQIVPQPVAPSATLRPLCVDLDGTLVKSDTLIDSLLALARNRPALLFALPGRVLRGKAAFKAFVTDAVSIDVIHLPYNRALLQFLQAERAKGREIYLATGADQRLAERVAKHLGIFSGVLGSDGRTNLTGNSKLKTLRSHLDSRAFDYIGNDTPDLPLLANATEAMVANPSLRLRMGLRRRGIRPAHEFEERGHPLNVLVRALRLHQWGKNLLIFAPLFLSHHVTVAGLLSALVAFCCFSMTASAAYIINDLLDIDADRHHPQKRQRPFACGDLSAVTGLGIVLSFLILAFSGAQLLPRDFLLCLLLYLATTLGYSAYLKRIAIVDVLVLSGLYALRLLAGGAATQTTISHWLAGFAIFLFLSLAIVKRFAELENLRASGSAPANGRGYLVADIEQIRSFGTASAFAAVVVFANYISGFDVIVLYQHPQLLWLIEPCMILWLCRVWLLASRGQLNEDPVVFALTDKMSLLIGVVVVVIATMAALPW